jgi:Flp pilus assembly protein TadG
MRKRSGIMWRDARGVAAIEFALIAPVFMAILFGIIAFGVIFGTFNGVQQLAAEAARASVGGLSPNERAQLASTYVSQNVAAYVFLDPSKVQVTTSAQTNIFQVTVAYDMSNSFIFGLHGLVLLSSPVIKRTAAIQNGGF